MDKRPYGQCLPRLFQIQTIQNGGSAGKLRRDIGTGQGRRPAGGNSGCHRQKVILKAVDSLPRKLRQIVVWYEFEEMSYDEIARKTGLPAGTVKSRLFNARKILSEKLQFLKENRNE